MIQPAAYDLTIQQNATFSLVFTFKDSSGSPINMTGYAVDAELWAENRAKKLADFTVTWINQSSGQVQISLPYVTTSKLGADGVWDLLVTNPDGTRDYWLRGRATVDVGYTS